MNILLLALLCSGVSASPIHKYQQKSFSSQKTLTLTDSERAKCISVMKKNSELEAKNKNPGNMFFISDEKCLEILGRK